MHNYNQECIQIYSCQCTNAMAWMGLLPFWTTTLPDKSCGHFPPPLIYSLLSPEKDNLHSPDEDLLTVGNVRNIHPATTSSSIIYQLLFMQTYTPSLLGLHCQWQEVLVSIHNARVVPHHKVTILHGRQHVGTVVPTDTRHH